MERYLDSAAGLDFTALAYWRGGPRGGQLAMQVTCDKNNRVTAEFQGELDVEQARTLVDKIQSKLASMGASGVRLFMDFRGMSSCALGARAALMNFQREIANEGVRTAYLSDVPRIRGMAHILVHTAEDSDAKSCGTLEQAEAWLVSEANRIEETTLEAGRAIEGLG